MVRIPIVRSSVRHNPLAGNSRYVVPLHMTMDISGYMTRKQYDQMVAGDGIIRCGCKIEIAVTNYALSTTGTIKFDGMVHSTMDTVRTFRLLRMKFGEKLHWNVHYNHDVVRSLVGESPFKFNYELKTKFNCTRCNHGPMTVKALTSETYIDDEGEDRQIEDLCPNCHEQIDIHYERMTDTDLHSLADKNKARRADGRHGS